MGRKPAVFIPLLLVIIVLIAVVYDQSPGEDKTEELNPVHFGVIPRDNPLIAYEKYQPLIDHLTELTPYTFELVLKKTYDETISALGNGEIDVAFLGPLTYLHARVDYGVIPIVKGVTAKGTAYYTSVVVVREGSPVQNLADLKGKSMAFASLKSTSGNLMPRYLLANEGIHVKDLLRYRQFDFQDSVVKWVLKGEYDAGAVRQSVAEKYVPFGLKIIGSSHPIPTGPLVAGSKTPASVIKVIRNTLLEINDNEAGRAVLKNVDAEMKNGFTAVSDSDYEQIRKLINAVPKGCGIGCHPKIKKL